MELPLDPSPAVLQGVKALLQCIYAGSEGRTEDFDDPGVERVLQGERGHQVLQTVHRDLPLLQIQLIEQDGSSSEDVDELDDLLADDRKEFLMLLPENLLDFILVLVELRHLLDLALLLCNESLEPPLELVQQPS